MDELVIFTTANSIVGLNALDLSHHNGKISFTNSTLNLNYKNCISDLPGTLAMIGSQYIAVAQAKKPQINIYQYGKSQVTFQCHIQEIITSLVSDVSGSYLFGGTKKGWIYCWYLSTGELINSFQAHFKQISRLAITTCGLYLISTSDDGMGRVWEMFRLVDNLEVVKHLGRHSLTAYRTWNSHTLPIKDMSLLESLSYLRVLTCSLDRTIVLFDTHQNRICFRISLPYSIESVVGNLSSDRICCGSSNGSIYMIDLNSKAVSISMAHAKLINQNVSDTNSKNNLQENVACISGILEGHSKAITSLCFSSDNITLISSSLDGSLRLWNTLTRQCIGEYNNINKNGITNSLTICKPEFNTGLSNTKTTTISVQHLQKYLKNSKSNANTLLSNEDTDVSANVSLVLGPALLARHDNMIFKSVVFIYDRCYPVNDQRKRSSEDLEEAFISLDGNNSNASNKKECNSSNSIKNQLKEALETIQILQNIINEKKIDNLDSNNSNHLQIYN